MDTDLQRIAEQPPHPGKGNAEKLKPNPCPPLLPISAFAPVVSSFQLPFLGSTNGTRFSQAPNGGSGLRIAIGKGFVMVENLFRDYPPGDPPWHRSPFFIRVIRAIRGSNCCEWIA